MLEAQADLTGRVIGRYVLYSEIAAGGMATVHLGRLRGVGGFSRTVAIKRLHPQFAKDPEFVAMFLDEARLAGRIRHPNVASVLDVVALEGELFLVMEFVLGESLSRLLRNAATVEEAVPISVAVAVVGGTLRGLHAAHEATSESGEALNLVHRDVSPHNIQVGVDGVPRVVDFGVAKAANRAQTTREGQLKGKLSYMSPEQVHRDRIDRRTDIYAAAVVLWETLVGHRLFGGDDTVAILNDIICGAAVPPSRHRPEVPHALDEVVMRGLSLRPDARFSTAKEMAEALEDAFAPASAARVGDWVEATAEDAVDRRARSLAEVESAGAQQVVVRRGDPGHDGPERDEQTLALTDPEDSSSPSGTHAQNDATVVDGSIRQAPSIPSITSTTGSLVRHVHSRQRNIRLAVGLGIALAGVAAGLLLGRGESRPTQSRAGGGAVRRSLAMPAQPGSASQPGAQADPAVADSAAAAEGIVTPDALPLESSAAAGGVPKPVSARRLRRSRNAPKRGKGTSRLRSRAPEPEQPEEPPASVDFDDLTRK
jgi:serine/threonine protein kinase